MPFLTPCLCFFATQIAATDVEDEIRDLAAEIASAKEELETEQLRVASLMDTETSLATKMTFKKDVGSLRREAGSSLAEYAALERIHRWQLVRMGVPSMSFKFLGSFPESSMSLAFDISKENSVIGHRAKIDPSGYKPRAGPPRKLSLSAASFLKRKTGEVIAKCQKTSLRDPSEIGPLLQNLDWRIGRLEHLAVELSAVASDYQSNVLFGGKEVALEVELAGCLVTFELNALYPFLPLTVRIDVFERKGINVKALQRHLVKRVKPGYQYITRTLEGMAEYLSISVK